MQLDDTVGELKFVCGDCKRPLTVFQNNDIVSITPCYGCRKEAWDEGYEEGQFNGYEE